MAHSPALLQGYLELSRAMEPSAIPRPLSEKISLAVQEWLGCALCLEAHTAARRSVGHTDADISLARAGTATDARDAALVTYGVGVLTEPDTIADVVGLVGLNQLTGAFNLVVGLEPAASPT